MNLCNKQIFRVLVLISVSYWAAAEELSSNSLTETRLTDDSNVGVNWNQGIRSRNTGFYNIQHAYSYLPASHQNYNGFNQISSRDSASQSIDTPIQFVNPGVNSDCPLSDPGYASSSYSQDYSSAAYPGPSYPFPSISSYPVPNYGPEDLVPHDYEEHQHEKNKFAKKQLALSISLPLILVPLAVLGILALLNFRAVFTVLVIRSLCTNAAFRTNFSQLCTFIGNINNKRSNDDISGFKNMRSRSHEYSRLMSLLNSARFITMEHLNTMTKEK